MARRAFDTLKIPPTVTLEVGSDAASPHPTTAEEGRFLPLAATVTDDVQVRNVEFYVDDVRVDVDGNFPFESRVLAPRMAAGKTGFTVKARATDTGGNAAFSNGLTFTLTPDTVGPTVLSFAPGNDALLGSASGFTARFTERVTTATLNAATVYLWSAGADGSTGTDDDASPGLSGIPLVAKG